MSPLVALVGCFAAETRDRLRGLLLEEIRDVELIETADFTRLTQTPDAVFVGSTESVEHAVDQVRQIRGRSPSLPVVLLVPQGSERTAVAALRAGASDYFSAPFAWFEIEKAVRDYLLQPRRKVPEIKGGDRLVGHSDAMVSVKNAIARFAPTASNVLITGETGTGKELVAELIHNNSLRANNPFVCINCAAIPENLLESELFGYEKGAFTGAAARQSGKLRLGSSGTVFLDEIGDMSLASQAKLLRAIETRSVFPLGASAPVRVDIRIVAATNQQLEELVEQNRFRRDLYFRLNVGRIKLAPLRERRTDIPQIAILFLRDFSKQFGRHGASFTREAFDLLLAHDWPGNVRELRNVVESAFLASTAHQFGVTDLPESVAQAPLSSERGSEKDRLVSALAATRWNKSAAARQLNWSRMTIYRKMLKYRLVSADETFEEAM